MNTFTRRLFSGPHYVFGDEGEENEKKFAAFDYIHVDADNDQRRTSRDGRLGPTAIQPEIGVLTSKLMELMEFRFLSHTNNNNKYFKCIKKGTLYYVIKRVNKKINIIFPSINNCMLKKLKKIQNITFRNGSGIR